MCWNRWYIPFKNNKWSNTSSLGKRLFWKIFWHFLLLIMQEMSFSFFCPTLTFKISALLFQIYGNRNLRGKQICEFRMNMKENTKKKPGPLHLECWQHQSMGAFLREFLNFSSFPASFPLCEITWLPYSETA